MKLKSKQDKVKILDLIIIGAGPAGISLAVEAVHSGIEPSKILVVERAPEHSWAIRKFYPDKKKVTANFKGKKAVCNGVMCIPDLSKDETLTYLDQAIFDNKINVNYSETILKIERNEESEIFHLISDRGEYFSKICVIAIGIFGKPNRPSYLIPSNVKKQVSFDVTSQIIKNKKILIVGGGDSASEYAQFLLQEGNKIIISYRQKEFIRMNNINRKSIETLIKEKQVSVMFESNIELIEEFADNVSNLENAKIKVVFESNHDDLIVDHIVYALGGTSPENFLKILNIEFDGKQPTFCENFETSITGLFLIGDLSAGKKGGSIISAFNSSNKAMEKICNNYLECKLT